MGPSSLAVAAHVGAKVTTAEYSCTQRLTERPLVARCLVAGRVHGMTTTRKRLDEHRGSTREDTQLDRITRNSAGDPLVVSAGKQSYHRNDAVFTLFVAETRTCVAMVATKRASHARLPTLDVLVLNVYGVAGLRATMSTI